MVLRVRDVMCKRVITATESTTVIAAVKMMKKNSIGSIIIVRGSAAIGIITSTDILERAVALEKNLKKESIKVIMSSPLITISPDASLKEAAELMAKNSIKKLAVVGADGELLGIITATDLIRNGTEFVNILINLSLPKPPSVMGG